MLNDNLAKQIKLTEKAWMIDYQPFDGQKPDNWELISLSDIADFVSGYSYKGNELQQSNIAMATIKNFSRNGGFKLDGYKELKPSSKIKTNQYAKQFDILVAHTDLTQNAEVIGNAELILSLSKYKEIVFSMDLVKVVPKNGISKFLLAALLQDQRFKAHCLGYINGTTVLHLSKKALPDYQFYFPVNPSVLNPLSNLLQEMYKQMANLVEENRKLEKLRDLLLPKLLSGDIDLD